MRSMFSVVVLAAVAPLVLFGCSEYALDDTPDSPELVDLDGDGIPDDVDDFVDVPGSDPDGGSPLRDTDLDGELDSEDEDADGDGVPNELDSDPDGDGAPGWTLPEDPADDPPIDRETDLPELQPGDARGRVCAPNGTTWVAGATVTVQAAQGTWETETNGDGWWQLPGLPAGPHEVTIVKGSFSMSFSITVLEGEVTEAVFDECLEQGDLTIAVVTGQYDAIGAVLDGLAIEFESVNGLSENDTTAFLNNASALDAYDMVFFNCGMGLEWATEDHSGIAANLQSFVADGGSIYASDWAYYTVEAAFPDKNTFAGDDAAVGDAFRGVASVIDSEVIDPAMEGTLGSSTAIIDYDLGGWVPVESTGAGVETLLTGDFQIFNEFSIPVPTSGPLATRFEHGQGSVTYTSFHNEAQATLDMDLLLQDIVLSL